MPKNQFTFNDLPEVLGELCDRIASMESFSVSRLSILAIRSHNSPSTSGRSLNVN